MKTNPTKSSSKPALTIQFHLTDGSIKTFVQNDSAAAGKIWDSVDPSRLFARPRIVLGSEHSKTVLVSTEIIRVDFIQEEFTCWQFPGGYSDIVELSEAEFQKHARFNEPGLMPKREDPATAGDLRVSFLRLQMRGGSPHHVMVEAPIKLPVESLSFMQFLLSKGSLHMRLRGGGTGVLNLANLVAFTAYPGVPQIPADSWIAEPTNL
jgi:hypothetical protein